MQNVRRKQPLVVIIIEKNHIARMASDNVGVDVQSMRHENHFEGGRNEASVLRLIAARDVCSG